MSSSSTASTAVEMEAAAMAGEADIPVRLIGGPVESRQDPVRGNRRGQSPRQYLVAHLVADRGDGGRAPQALLELVADQRPGERQLLLRPLGLEPGLTERRAVRQHL